MRILIVSDITGYMRGGVPAETRQLINGLVASGHAVACCSDIAVPGAVPVAHFSLDLPTGTRLPEQVRKAVEVFVPDVVHVVAMSSRGVLALRQPLAGVPWVMTCHSIPPYERKISGLHSVETAHYAARAIRFFAHAAAWRWLLHRGTVPHVIVHSAWVQGLVIDYGQPATKTTLIPLASAAPVPEPVPGGSVDVGAAPRLVTVGGIAHTKGQHDAITAVGLLRQRYPGVTYQIIGEVRDDSYLRFLQSMISRLGLQASVEITPGLAEAEKEQALRTADLYLQPSHEEGFCLAYIEAARTVTRLVGTDAGAIRFVSEGDAGARVVPPRRPTELAAAMAALLAEPMSGETMARRRARLDARFGVGQYVEAHERLYRTLGEGRAAS